MNPLLKKRLARFRRERRAFFSFCLLFLLFTLALFCEGLCNNTPFIVRYQGKAYFPMFRFVPASEFGVNDAVTPDFKKLRQTAAFRKKGNWMLFPPIPYGPNESIDPLPGPPPSPPTRQNWLGTDDRGRDLLTRLIYGFRNSMLFAMISWLFIVCAAYLFGALQGYFGGRVDFYGQRLTEIWDSLPVLYVVVFLLGVIPPSLWLLTVVWVAFGWISLGGYIRAEVLRVRKQDFILAARALGVGTPRLLIRHVLPNTLTPILTLSPFIISTSVGSLAALDYLGLGLPPPTASWGELLRQGKENIGCWWLAAYPFLSLFGTMLLLNFIGEGARTAFDPRADAG